MKTRINVPEEYSDIVEKLGAKFDKKNKFWYIPEGTPIVIFEQFIHLTIELVPSKNWYNNLRSILSKEEWDILRREQYKKANYTCEICGNKQSLYFDNINHLVECHEIWEYDDEYKIQTLKGLIALCHDCHRAKHRGKANIDGVGDIVDIHIANINKWSIDAVRQYVYESFFVWNERSNYNWELKIDLIK